MNQYSAYSLVSMLNGNNASNNTNPQSGYPYSNNQPPGFNNQGFNRNSPSQHGYNDKKGPYFDYNNKNRPYNGWGQKTDPESNVDEVVAEHSFTVLDSYNSDLNLQIDLDGYGAYPLTEPEGFCFCWAGARATYGVTRGKVFFEIHITEALSVVYGDNHQEADPHVVRVGWSVDSCCFQLGESENSYGYGGTGKFSVALKFSDYGERFGVGDVIGSLLDLQSYPPTISFTKNGHWFGTAYTLNNYLVGVKSKALFPHVLSKNCRFKVNFGQTDAWFAPPPGFVYIDHVPLDDRVRGLKGPAKKANCEMNMIVGLPGSGKTTLGINKQKENVEKRYNIIGTDTLIDKMRVMGLPRKRNYHGRWDVLIGKASKCLNKLFQVASRRKRNYILDQTNVYASARRNKMKHFLGFQRNAWVLVPEDDEFERRSVKRTVEDGKVVPVEAVLEMKANFKLPLEGVDPFDKIEFIELQRDKAAPLVDDYVKEGIEKRPIRDVFRHENKYQPRHNMPSPVCSSQSAQQKIPDSFTTAMAAISHPAVKLEPGTIKIEPGLPADQGSLTTPVATPPKPDVYILSVSTTTAAAATVKTEPVSAGTADSRMSIDSQKEDKESKKGNSNDTPAKSGSSSSTTDRKTGYREESRRHDRRDEHRHRSRSRSRSRSHGRGSRHYRDRSRYDSRYCSEDRRDRHSRDRYRERGHDVDRHRSRHRSDSHGRSRGSDSRYRDRRDERDRRDKRADSYHSDRKSTESQSQNSTKSASDAKSPSTNYQSPQKPGDAGSLESKWSQSDPARQPCPSGDSDYQSSGIPSSRHVVSPFNSTDKQDKSDLADLFGRQDVDYRMPSRGSYSNDTSRSQLLPTNNIKPNNYTSWQPQSQSYPIESNPYGQPRVSEQPPSRLVPPTQSQMPLPGPAYPQHPPPPYSEVKIEPSNTNYQNYPTSASSSYPERNDRFSSANSAYPPTAYGERSAPASDNSGNYLPGKEDDNNFNRRYPGVMPQSTSLESQYGYTSNNVMRNSNLDARTGYTPLNPSPANVGSQLTASLYPPYASGKPTPPSSETNAVHYQSGNDSDLRFGVNVRNENASRMPNTDNNNGRSVSGGMESVSVSSSNNTYVTDRGFPDEPFRKSTNVQLPDNDNIKRQDSYSFSNQSGPVYRNDYNSPQRWGNQALGDGASSFSGGARDVPATMPSALQQQGQWSEMNRMDSRLAPPPQGNFGVRFPANTPDYSTYPNMPQDMNRRYPF